MSIEDRQEQPVEPEWMRPFRAAKRFDVPEETIQNKLQKNFPSRGLLLAPTELGPVELGLYRETADHPVTISPRATGDDVEQLLLPEYAATLTRGDPVTFVARIPAGIQRKVTNRFGGIDCQLTVLGRDSTDTPLFIHSSGGASQEIGLDFSNRHEDSEFVALGNRVEFEEPRILDPRGRPIPKDPSKYPLVFDAEDVPALEQRYRFVVVAILRMRTRVPREDVLLMAQAMGVPDAQHLSRGLPEELRVRDRMNLALAAFDITLRELEPQAARESE